MACSLPAAVKLCDVFRFHFLPPACWRTEIDPLVSVFETVRTSMYVLLVLRSGMLLSDVSNTGVVLAYVDRVRVISSNRSMHPPTRARQGDREACRAGATHLL